jgi:hypothetical protein
MGCAPNRVRDNGRHLLARANTLRELRGNYLKRKEKRVSVGTDTIS